MKLIEIYNFLKEKYSFDMVAIQEGLYCRVYNEDAIWMNEKWGWKIAEHKKKGQVEYIYTGFRTSNKALYAQRFEENDLKYAIVSIKDYDMGVTKPPFTRHVEFSSVQKAVGREFESKKTFIEKIKQTSSKGEEINDYDDFLQGILAGVNITTGEKLSDDSAWNHPEIRVDINYYLLKSKEEKK
tara:strand:+ start:755 stop:1306 length:552 start_codon:yes stop_codon:yes gene_type:complete